MKFSVIGDLHYSNNLLNVEEFEEIREFYFYHFMKWFFEDDADLFFSIGDLTNTGHPDEVTGIYKIIEDVREGKEFIHVWGNHDLYTQKKEEFQGQTQTKPYFSFAHEGIAFIVLDSTREQNMADWSGYLDDLQLTWLAGELKRYEEMTVVIFCHHPVYDTTMFSTQDKASIVEEVPIRDLIFQHKKEAFFINGHTHNDSITKIQNWNFIQIADVMDQPTVRHFDLTDGSMKITSSTLDEKYRQYGTWLGSRMQYFQLLYRGYQGLENRETIINF
ncbi:metallophosphoesterase [Facklamia sp. DSM 111018]|uniref:Metallophosphoesterase n=1 Tax=Facklamia lactis TaxID=2749967 RepID=A0ABS0LUG7_9LACT|nr:metallophosphoesterase family protein [Facklamia lactis]MBG9981143.1 metallophosphoesterase [Facklamia lactis]MBG9986944.1 metallophosphoesterase [Facklamia lactis]